MSDITRRSFLALSGVALAATNIKGAPAIIGKAKPIELPPLPYADNALAPIVSANTISFHYGKHHKGYLDNLNKQITGTAWADATLEKIVMDSAKDKTKVAVFNNAAQVWNHNFYWNSLKPNGGGKPTGKIADSINRDFGSYESFRKQLLDTSVSQFGTGWGWLVADKKGKLSIINTEDADLPMTRGLRALLTIDVWEHAYYLDYQNRRAAYVEALIDKLLNWEFAEKNLG